MIRSGSPLRLSEEARIKLSFVARIFSGQSSKPSIRDWEDLGQGGEELRVEEFRRRGCATLEGESLQGRERAGFC